MPHALDAALREEPLGARACAGTRRTARPPRRCTRSGTRTSVARNEAQTSAASTHEEGERGERLAEEGAHQGVDQRREGQRDQRDRRGCAARRAGALPSRKRGRSVSRHVEAEHVARGAEHAEQRRRRAHDARRAPSTARGRRM